VSAAPALAAPQEACFHCAEPLDPHDVVFTEIDDERRGFCCHGCLGAAELIHALGLGAYYDRRDMTDTELIPLAAGDATAYVRFDDPALQKRFVSRDEDGVCSTGLSVSGMRCAACSWLLEERLARLAGVCGSHFGLAGGRAQVRWDPARVRLSEILGAVAALGYRALPFEPDAAEAMLRSERRAALRRLGVSGLGTMQVMMFSVALHLGAAGTLEAVHRDLLRLAAALVTAPVLLFGGWPFLGGAWRDVAARRIGPDVPIALALLGAYLASVVATAQRGGDVYFDTVCMFVFFISLGRTLEHDLRAKAEMRIAGLVQRVPRSAHRLEDGTERDVPAEELAAGDVVVVRPGEGVPADGVVIEGEGEVSESLLTGEASPVAKHQGSMLLAGSENLQGTLRMRVERTGAASTLQQIASLLDRAQLEKPPIAVLAGRVAQVFVASVVLIACGVGLAWWWIDSARVVPIVVSVLIATCPCALSLATPSALAAATHGLAARGFLITRGHALEALARVGRVVFDKTGTLTAATLRLADVQPVRDSIDAEEALRLARLLEGRSKHPIARALRCRSRGRRPQAAIGPAGLEYGGERARGPAARVPHPRDVDPVGGRSGRVGLVQLRASAAKRRRSRDADARGRGLPLCAALRGSLA
jgi:Cu2+-exporting ATPase